MFIYCRFDEVLAIRWPKMMTFSITGSQIFFANFVIFARNERKTAYQFIVNTTNISTYCKYFVLILQIMGQEHWKVGVKAI